MPLLLHKPVYKLHHSQSVKLYEALKYELCYKKLPEGFALSIVYQGHLRNSVRFSQSKSTDIVLFLYILTICILHKYHPFNNRKNAYRRQKVLWDIPCTNRRRQQWAYVLMKQYNFKKIDQSDFIPLAMVQGVNNTSQMNSIVTCELRNAPTFAIACFSDAMVQGMFYEGLYLKYSAHPVVFSLQKTVHEQTPTISISFFLFPYLLHVHSRQFCPAGSFVNDYLHGQRRGSSRYPWH